MLFSQKGYKNKVMSSVSSTESDFNTLASMAKNPQQANVSNLAEAQSFKASQLSYLIAGDLRNGVRGNDTYSNASLIFVDFDSIDDEDKFLSSVAIKLVHNNYVLYPSISYGFKGTRYHLAVEPSRPLVNKYEKVACISSINHLLNIESDEAMTTWAQMFSAPVLTQANSRGKFIVHNGGQKFDVDAAVASYQPSVKTSTATMPATRGNHEAVLPDDFVLETLSEYAFEQHVETEKAFSDKMLQLIAYYQAGIISMRALDKAMVVLANGNQQWAIDNQAKLAEHMRHQLEPNKMSFKVAFRTTTIIHERADESRQYSAKSIALALSLKAATRLKELKNKQMKVNPRSTKEPALSFSDIADIILSSVPMFVDRSMNNSPLYIWDAEKGIYSIDQHLFASYARRVAPNISNKTINDLQFTMMNNDRARSGEVIHEKNLVACANGIVDIQKQKLIPFSPIYHFITKVGTRYNPNAKPVGIQTKNGEWRVDRWLQMLANGDKETLALLYQIIGDSAQSSFSRRQAVWLIGDPALNNKNGSNGKSSYEALLEAVVGKNNTAHLKIDQFSERFAMNDLVGKSLVTGDDIQAGKFITDQSNFNSAVTGDVLRVDVKNAQPFNYTFSGTIVQSTNEMPRFANPTGGTTRRNLIVPFLHHFDVKEANEDIKKDFIHREEVREYCLYMGLRASAMMDTFIQPSASKSVMEEFKRGNDQVGEFLDDSEEELNLGNCEVVPVSWIYNKFRKYAMDAGFQKIMSRPNFSRKMAEYGWAEKRTRITENNFKPVMMYDEEGLEGKIVKCLARAK